MNNQETNTTNTTTPNNTTTTTLNNKYCLDSLPTQIDSLNNNSSNFNHFRSSSNPTTTKTTPTPTPTTTTTTRMVNTQTSLNNNGAAASTTHSSPDDEQPSATKPPQKRRRSLLNFKSLDFHLKSLYSGLRNGNQKNTQSQASSVDGPVPGSGGIDNAANGSDLIAIETPSSRRRPSASTVHNRMPPYLKIEAVDCEESANLLLDYAQSPYSSRRNSSHDDNRSTSQLLHTNRYGNARSQTSSPSPSPYFLSPYTMNSSGNMGFERRSSTSDITSCKRSSSSSGRDSRRPSTSDLLRKARERRGSEARMGRSVSHGGLPRGGGGGGCHRGGGGGGGRRTSMAF